MTGLFIAFGLALLVAAGIALGARMGRKGWEPLAAALLFGVAGYAWQGRPDLPGRPMAAGIDPGARFDEALAARRRAIGERVGPAAKWLVLSDGLARQGRTQDAANVLARAVALDPRDMDLWVGLGNALVLHGGGVLSPAADYAFRQALRRGPDAPSPRFFYGLALARSGRLNAARAIWAELTERLPAGTPFRAELESDIAGLDTLIARQNAGANGGGGGAAPIMRQ